MISCVRFVNNWFRVILFPFEFLGLRKEDLEVHAEELAERARFAKRGEPA